MMRNRMRVIGATFVAIIAIADVGATIGTALKAQRAQAKMPTFQWDPTWPKPLPEKWAVGPVVGVSVDSATTSRPSIGGVRCFRTSDTRPPPGNTPIAECCVPAPPILEFDHTGHLLSSWGGPGAGYEWPQSEHGIYVDAKGYVWTAGNGAQDAQILKFTREGTFVLQIGRSGKSTGNNDTQNVQRAADMKVDPTADELYVADGYGNRRIVVFDADTGAFKRMWGAYGDRPDDADISPSRSRCAARQAVPDRPRHRDLKASLVYVGDRSNDRVQVFKKDGTFVKEVLIAKHTRLSGSASGVAFWADPQRRCLYVLDGANHRVLILLGASLRILGLFAGTAIGAGSSTCRTTTQWTAKGMCMSRRRWKAAASSGFSTRVWLALSTNEQ